MNDFIILNKVKWLLGYSDKYVFNTFTKVNFSIKIRLENNLYNLLENCIRANINKGNIRNKYQNEMLVSINLLDFYIGEALDKKIIKKNRFSSFVNAINEIRKMTISWSNYEEKVKFISEYD